MLVYRLLVTAPFSAACRVASAARSRRPWWKGAPQTSCGRSMAMRPWASTVLTKDLHGALQPMQMRPSSSSSVSWMVLDSHAWCLTACADISSISSTLCSLQMSPFSVVPDSVFIPVCSSQASDCSVTMASRGSFPARDRYQAAADAASSQGHCTWTQSARLCCSWQH